MQNMYNIKNCIYLGNVFHARLSPKQHKLNYNVFYLNIKLTKKGYYESTFQEISNKNINGKNLEITKKFFSKLENQINIEPKLWLWSHKRWKHTN